MQRIRQIKIKTRLVVTFGIVMVLFAAAVGVSIQVDHNMSIIMEGFYDRQFRIVVDTQTINGSVEGICRNLLFAIASEDEAVSRQSMENARDLGAEVQRALEELKLLYTEDPALMEALESSYDKLPITRQEISKSLMRGDYESARRLYIQSYAQHAEIARDVAAQIFANAEQDAAEYIEKSNQNSSRLITVITGISVVMGVFMLVMSIVIVRSITRPIEELKTASECHARGNLKAELRYDAPDELGELADSMRSSTASLSHYIDEIEHSLSALGSGDFDYKIKDIFEGDFVAIRESIVNVAELLKAQRYRDAQSMLVLEDALEAAAQANQAKTDFLSSMSHDIRTPMNAITGMTAIALTNIDDQQKVRNCLEKVSMSSKHLLGLINDILDMSKIESGKMALNKDNMSLPEVMENITTITQPQIKAKKQNFNIRLRNVQHEKLYGDSLRLNQVLINVLSNAVKFTPFGGSVTVDIEELDSARPGYANFIFRVTDTGVGMKPEFVQEIFTPFSRAEGAVVNKTEGTGLGMAIVKKIVDMMDGAIEVQSTENVGSTFTISLHFKVAEIEEAEMKLPPLRILVVDDDEAAAETISGVLADIGVAGEWVGTGAEAVEKALAAHQEGTGYDAIIQDYQMPGMNGLQVARAIREKVDPRVPILIISAYDWSDIEDEARNSGVDGFMSKPLFRTSLYAAIRRYVLDKDSGAESKAAQHTLGDYSDKTILLVDDNEINREVAMELLRMTHVQVECAENGVEAVTMFAESPEGKYDLILMDIQMPLMDGYEATRQIRALHRDDAKKVPIMAMTANAFSEDIDMARASGMDYHMAKPLDTVLLMRRLRDLFE